MKNITANELRAMFLNFFQEKGHKLIPSASVIPENDPTVLFTTAGMHPLVPYLMGQKHPMGTRLTDVQKCIRTGDIDEVGDMSHLTFFEMLGNWSLGDYWACPRTSWPSPSLRATRTAPGTKRPPTSGGPAASRTTTCSTCPRLTTGGAPPASPAPADRTPKCS